MAALLVGARLPRTRPAPVWLGRLRARADARRRARPPTSSTAPASASGCRRWSTPTAASRRTLALVATFPQLEYPRLDVPPAVRVTGPLLWERPAERRRAAARRRAAGAGGAEHLAGPRPAHGPRRPGRAGRRARAGPGHAEPPPLPVAAGRARQRAGGRLALLRAHDAPAAPPWSATPATAPWPARWPAACPWSAAPRRATWPRTPPGWPGRASASRSRAGSSPRAACGWRCASCWPTRRYAERAGELRAWAERHDGAAVAADAVEELAADQTLIAPRAWDSNP